MRKSFVENEGERKKFTAEMIRFGKRINYKGYSEMTVLLKNITDAESGKIMTDHLWFSYTAGFEKAGIKEGCIVQFEARIKEYTKGYVNKSIGINQRKKDFKLSNPTKIMVIQSS